ncbi:MAG: hypothetical protein ACP5RO_03085 [Fervidicoccaceae archaeon]
MSLVQSLSVGSRWTEVKNDSPKISIFLDWDESSSETIKEVLEAKKELLLKYLIDVEIESNYVNINTGAYLFSERIPSVYVNGRLISSGRSPKKEEILEAILEIRESLPITEGILMTTQKENEPPLNSAVMLEA